MFGSLPILLLLILGGGLNQNSNGVCNGVTNCESNKNTLAMCLCLLLLSDCDPCGGSNFNL